MVHQSSLSPRARRRVTKCILFGLLTLTAGFTLLVLEPSGAGREHVTHLYHHGKSGVNKWWSSTYTGVSEEAWIENVEQFQQSHLDEGEETASCASFDPTKPEEEDPKDCLRARQYRQVERVLDRERKGEHEHWEFTKAHNIAALEHLLTCFSASSSPCPPKPLILSGYWYTAEVLTGATTGEVIWQKGLMKQVEKLGISFISVGPYENWITVAEMMPDVYRVIWTTKVESVTCITDPRCIAKDHYVPPENATDLSIGVPEEERGVIPLWALNAASYWGAMPKEVSHNAYWWGLTEDGDWSSQPLGQQWIVTPWALPGHVHLPYSIEDHCMQIPITPQEERNNSVLIFAKRSAYFDYQNLSPKHFWTDLAADPSLDLLLTAKEEEGHPLPDGLVSLGYQSREEYQALVGGVKVLLGMGAPKISPSVYTALCQATPVVIPYFVPNARTDGWYLYSGFSQHGPAQMIGEPYVYSYYAQDFTQLSEVVHRALDTPIQRFIPPEMKFEYGLEQMRRYLDRDAKAMFQDVVMENGGSVPRLIAGARERCYELKRCLDELPSGRRPASPPAHQHYGRARNPRVPHT